MTEAEWLTCTDPLPMLEFLRGKASERKLYLFAAACCGHIRHAFNDANSRREVEAAERNAVGQAENAERRAAALAVGGGSGAAGGEAECALVVPPLDAAEQLAANAATVLAIASGLPMLRNHQINPAWQIIVDRERASQCDLLRDIFGVLGFRSVSLHSSCLAWNDYMVVTLAQGIYDDHAFNCLPILANALEEAGCTDAEILGHCRHRGPHVRGCWVVDLLTGRQ